MLDREHIQTNLPEVAVFVTLELSKSAWLLAAQAASSGKTTAHRVSGGDVEGLLALLRRLQTSEQCSSSREVAIILGYEAGYDGFWLQRRLAAEGITCFVMDPGSLQVDRRARRAKTGRLDAAMLLQTLMAWCRGDHAACHMVQVHLVERENARRTHRERQRLIAERVQRVNRIKRLLATQGVYMFQPLRRDRWERLKEVRTGDGCDLPQGLRGEIEPSSGGWNSRSNRLRPPRPSAMPPRRIRPSRTPTPTRWRVWPGSVASAPPATVLVR